MPEQGTDTRGLPDARGASATTLVSWAVLIGALLAIGAWLIHLGSGTTFFRDEWNFVLFRTGESTVGYFGDHAGQEVWGQAFIFINLFRHAGLDNYVVYRLVALPVLLGCSALVYWVGSRRLGAWGALAPALLIPLMGFSYLNLLWPLEILTFPGPAFFGVAAFLAMEKRDRKFDVAACFFLVLGLGLSGFSIAFIVGAAFGLILFPSRDLKRLWIPAIPAVIYLVWAQKYGTQEVDLGQGLIHAPGFMHDMAVYAISHVTGLGWTLSVVVFAGLVVLIGFRLWRLGREEVLAWQATAALVTFWLLTALARNVGGVDDARTSRYVWPTAFLLILILVVIAPRDHPRRWGIVATVLVLVVLPHNLSELKSGSDDLRDSTTVTRAELGAAEIGRPAIDPKLNMPLLEYQFPAYAYFAAIDRWNSSPADDPEELMDASDLVRLRADFFLAQAEEVTPLPLPQGNLAIDLSGPDARCMVLAPGKEFRVPDLSAVNLVVLGSAKKADLSIRRFGDQFQPAPGGQTRANRSVLTAPTDTRSSPAWQALVDARKSSVRVCAPGK